MYVRMDGKYRLSDMYIDRDDLLRADGALMELQELKRKIRGIKHENINGNR